MTGIFVLIIIVLTSIACAIIGNFLVLRKLSLMGDAISHAVLPGIVIAFFVAGTLDSSVFFVFAVLFAVITSMIIQWLSDHIKVSRESIIGIVFTALFAMGVILLVQFADNIHLDQDAVLFGQVEFAAFHRLIIKGVDLGPLALWNMSFVLALNILFVSLFYKELKISSFDSQLSDSLGFSSKKMHYLIMVLTAITVVAAFEAVGAVLVVALLVVPAATAYLISTKLSQMIVLSFLFAVIASVLGYYFAIFVDGSIAGSVAMVLGSLLFVVLFLQKIYRYCLLKKNI